MGACKRAAVVKQQQQAGGVSPAPTVAAAAQCVPSSQAIRGEEAHISCA
uniref:Uncharacterized protein n=1 Tax=Arundo donax TaxID=35708 RepID=A0A0A8ZX22_ARUDO